MKIAYITQSYPPMISGASLVVKNLAHGMAARGHSVLVIAASDQGQAYTIQGKGIKLVRLASVPNPKRAQQSFVLWSRKEIDEALKDFSPDILHIHDVLSMGVFGLQTAQTLDTPIVTTIHQLPWFITAYLPELPGLHGTVEYGLWEYSRWLNQQSHVMVVPTATIAETIYAKAGFRPEVISNGVDLDYFNNKSLTQTERRFLCQKYSLEPERPTILHVGRLDTDKKVEFVIRAAAKVMEKTSAQLLVIGDGEHRGDLMQLTQQLGIDKSSHFPGFVSPIEDLPDFYRLATVFITASEIETQGLVLLEALASGLPVVAANATCIPELVIDGKDGFLVNPRDVDGMADALNKIICNSALKLKMGKAGRVIVQEHSITASLNKHENLYSDLVAKHQETAQPAHTFSLFSLNEIGQSILQQLSNIKL